MIIFHINSTHLIQNMNLNLFRKKHNKISLHFLTRNKPFSSTHCAAKYKLTLQNTIQALARPFKASCPADATLGWHGAQT